MPQPLTDAIVNPELVKLMIGGSPVRLLVDQDLGLQLVLKYLTVVNATTSLESILYGMHCILFAICCVILAKKRQTTSMVFLTAAIVMFGLSTADFALSLRLQLADVPKFLQGKMSLDKMEKRLLPKGQLFVANNLIADILLLYRCSMVWGFRRSVLVVSILLLLADTVWGLIGGGAAKVINSWGAKFMTIYYWSIFCVNVVMTILIVGRIWWVTRRAGPHLGPRSLHIYHTIMVILVETAFVYSICVLMAIVIPQSHAYTALVNIMMMRFVSIMPTLLIVQIAGGRPFDDRFKKTTVGDVERPNPTRTTSIMLDTMITTRGTTGIIETQEVPSRENSLPNQTGASV